MSERRRKKICRANDPYCWENTIPTITNTFIPEGATKYIPPEPIVPDKPIGPDLPVPDVPAEETKIVDDAYTTGFPDKDGMNLPPFLGPVGTDVEIGRPPNQPMDEDDPYAGTELTDLSNKKKGIVAEDEPETDVVEQVASTDPVEIEMAEQGDNVVAPVAEADDMLAESGDIIQDEPPPPGGDVELTEFQDVELARGDTGLDTVVDEDAADPYTGSGMNWEDVESAQQDIQMTNLGADAEQDLIGDMPDIGVDLGVDLGGGAGAGAVEGMFDWNPALAAAAGLGSGGLLSNDPNDYYLDEQGLRQYYTDDEKTERFNQAIAQIHEYQAAGGVMVEDINDLDMSSGTELTKYQKVAYMMEDMKDTLGGTTYKSGDVWDDIMKGMGIEDYDSADDPYKSKDTFDTDEAKWDADFAEALQPENITYSTDSVLSHDWDTPTQDDVDKYNYTNLVKDWNQDFHEADDTIHVAELEEGETQQSSVSNDDYTSRDPIGGSGAWENTTYDDSGNVSVAAHTPGM